MLGTLTIGGRSLSDFDLFSTDAGIYNAPEPDVDSVPIPGRSGNILRDNKRYKNIAIRYPCVITQDLNEQITAAKAYLLSDVGYVRIENSFEDDYFRMGRYIGGTEVTPTVDGTAAAFALEFDCMAQKFLTDGETAVTKTSSGSTINNPTLFTAKPLIKVTGSGKVTLTIGDYLVSITDLSSYIYLDCEEEDAYKTAGDNQNDNVVLPDGQSYPVLVPGDNEISWTGSVTSVEITPRWWTL